MCRKAAPQELESILNLRHNRRRGQRFSLRLAVEVRPIELPYSFDRTIVGESVNISSSGLLFTTAQPLIPGQVVEASIHWPVRLDNRVPLTLFVVGRVVRKVGNKTAMRIERYEFRTRSTAEGLSRRSAAGSF